MYQINDPGLENYDYTLDAKLFFLTTDARFLDSDVYHDADLVLMDVKDLTLRFLTKMNVSVARRLSKYQEVRFRRIGNFWRWEKIIERYVKTDC